MQFGARIFAKIMQQFEKGVFTPLPYSLFDAAEVPAAFQLMQQSLHTGKIVIRPNAEVYPASKSFEVNPDRTHIVTGAFGGFGLETAKWLGERGARYLVLIGRRGAASAEAKAALQDFAARGVKVIAEACDVSKAIADGTSL